MSRPTRSTVAGRSYLALQRLARRSGEATDELLTRFVLERFLYRVARSPYRDRLILKGGMLLEVFDVRRPTRDIDFLGRSIANDTERISALVRDVAAVEVDDGVVFLVDRLSAEMIREDAVYGGVRVRMPAELDRARATLRLDVSVGDPVVPPPVTVTYPTMLDGEPFELVGYPMVTLLAEKIETMVRRGAANTRERDFADVWTLIGRHQISGADFRRALEATVRHRGTTLVPLLQAVQNLGSVRQAAWGAYRRRARMDPVPEDFTVVIEDIARFVDPVIIGDDLTTWRPGTRAWEA
jgi:predicted nucleotidyltransferase component of viral defense system